MTADKGPEERKQERESKLVGRDKASNDTVTFIDNQLPEITDESAARAIAMLHEQINDSAPPAEEPFGYWHRELSVSTVEVSSVTDTAATVTVDLTALDFYDAAEVYVRISEVDPESIDTSVIETEKTTLTAAESVEITTESLSPDTKYNARAVAEAEYETGTEVDYGDSITFTTKSE